MKKSFISLLTLAISGLALVSCSNPSKMVKESQLVSVETTPKVLEVVAGEITANYSMNFPEGYFHPKAVMEVIPVLVYEGGEIAAPAFKLQGEKITDNFKVIPLAGAKSNHSVKFAYKPGMEVSHLELRVAVWNKDKKIDFPVAYKLADGANTTYMLVDKSGIPAYAADEYQKVIREKKETQILYKINSSVVRPKELTKSEIKEFEAFLASVKKDDRRAVTGTDILAYASPDGSEKLNSKLSDNRSATAKAAFDKITKKAPVDAPVNVTAIAEDWEGFQELVSQSTMQDKELILRVLSMYSDPDVREREIKNMSKVFRTLADKVLPELRRARFVANVDYTNYTDQELVELSKSNIDIMDAEALLYTATLVDDVNTKIKLLTKAGDKFKCDRAYNNLAALYLENGKQTEAAIALSKVVNKTTDYYYNNSGVIALREGDIEAAKSMLAKSKLPEAKQNLAVIDILEGRYNDAVSKLAGTGDPNEGLAYILTNQLDKASSVVKCRCARSSYLRAIVAARKGNMTEVAKELKAVHEKDEALKARSQKDIEFAKFRE
ncbi:MAG: hypothetical protein M0R37_00855 [Bacteroidales bacterium]|nr:hypothetical protein [Bacteroidales bacterium]